MTSQALCVAIHSSGVNDSDARSHTNTAINDMIGQLHADSKVTNTFYRFTTSYRLKTPYPSFSDTLTKTQRLEQEKQFIEECARELYGEGLVVPGDAWLVVDGLNRAGYGGSDVPLTIDGKHFRTNRVLHTPSQTTVPDPLETYIGLAMHEIAHCLEVGHSRGGYRLRTDGNDQIADRVSPMATCYVNRRPQVGDDSDTCAKGTANPPTSFCSGTTNHAADRFCGGCTNTCRHVRTLTRCTKDRIQARTPIPRS